jgi:glycosyltransferase involved in cell wall biosynthesis
MVSLEPKRVALLVAALHSKDAVGNDVSMMNSWLQEMGEFTVGIFTPSPGSDVAECRPTEELPNFLKSPSDILIYHHCIAWVQGNELYAGTPATRVLRYHNITPAEYYNPFNPAIGAMCQLGRDQAFNLAKVDDQLAISDSLYNAQELISWGLDPGKSRVLAPLHHVDDSWFAKGKGLYSSRPQILLRPQDTLKLLFVGRVAPQKGHDFCLEILYALREKLGVSAEITFVGSHSEATPRYNEFLHQRTHQLGLAPFVHWRKGLSHDELVAAYGDSHAFVLASHHEGFCVPIIEALGMGLPLYALPFTAVRETMGDQGTPIWSQNPMSWALRLRKDFFERGVKRPNPAEVQSRFGLGNLKQEFTGLIRKLTELSV